MASFSYNTSLISHLNQGFLRSFPAAIGLFVNAQRRVVFIEVGQDSRRNGGCHFSSCITKTTSLLQAAVHLALPELRARKDNSW